MCRSFDHSITNNKQLLYNTSLTYERRVDGALPSLPAHKLHSLRRQGTTSRGKGPSGFNIVTPATPSDSIYELNCGLFTLGDVLFDSSTKFDFCGFGVFAERKEPEWTQIDFGIIIVDFIWTLTLTFGCLLSTRHYSRESSSFYTWCTRRNHTNAYLWLWTHARCLGRGHGSYEWWSFLHSVRFDIVIEY